MKRSDISTHMQLECRRAMVPLGRSSIPWQLVGPTYKGEIIWQRVEVVRCGDVIRVKIDNTGTMLADIFQWVPASWLRKRPKFITTGYALENVARP